MHKSLYISFVVGAFAFAFGIPGYFDDANTWWSWITGEKELPQMMAGTIKFSLPVLGFLLMTVWPSYVGYKRFFSKPIQILYDPSDSRGRYSSMDIWERSDGRQLHGLVHRVGIRNNSNRTLRNVSATVEGDIADLFLPSNLRFVRNRQTNIDISPEGEELAEVFMTSDARPFDFEITASADDVSGEKALFSWIGGDNEPPLMRWRTPENLRDWQNWVGCG